MKLFFVFLLLAFGYVFSLWKFGGMDKTVMAKLDAQLQYEKKALALAKENRLLQVQISDLKYQISQLESKNKYFASQAKAPAATTPVRKIASVPKMDTNDLVNYEIYKWTPEKLLAIGEKELHFKNYEKSAQFYNELIVRHPKHEIVSDRVLFGAGVAAFETGKRYDWSEQHLERLVKNYPKSEFYRGAKLWLALAQYNQGEHQKFLKTVEEFRLKYRNTEEWKILSRYYEDISYKIKQ
ncbi:tetratricopeptide repeat protein [Peredibacter starrii]|uniref:Tetratricopeptide repeat protein n=1 Tax=Peredibacter starrii TaxID=28202 RepID=A0AAX4HN21_9BACT|nr:tetratricopeptide repeat protein [Peredibacter starrii]WPU64595.1 tetratricopeptide repeat protein [Peredibacter starrii]